MLAGPWREMTGKRKRFVRVAIVAAIALPFTLASSVPSFADHATQTDVSNAKAKRDQINQQLEVIVEQYDQARSELQQIQQQLAGAKQRMTQAQATADAARAQLGRRAADAYTGMGSQLDVLLGAQNFAEFSDRLEFMGALAQSDADLATEADTARQEADWARQQYVSAAADASAKLTTVNNKRSEVTDLLAQAAQTYAKTSAAYKSFLAAQAAAALAQQQQDNNPVTDPPPPDGGSYNPPPPDVTGAQRAIDAARQVQGTTYVFGSADPSVGFDCSGLTMWAWAQAGLLLPHSSAMQYAVLPHVALSDIQPGDLLFFYTPISHVALYIGGGMMIHARHPGPGGEVQETAISSYDQPVAAARP
jgi:cell wall-associated NlpC family hydrolase